jgi:hypothetical protein
MSVLQISIRHREEQSDEAIQSSGPAALDCFAPLAMTGASVSVLAMRFFASEVCGTVRARTPRGIASRRSFKTGRASKKQRGQI